jgi:hypothetical protein
MIKDMKVNNFDNYSDALIKEVVLKLEKPFSENDTTLPTEIFKYINTENPQIGNVMTRKNRCITLLHKQIILRFLR